MDFKIVRADIAKMDVDAVVLPANKSLSMGSGASYSIYKKAGIKELQSACNRIDKSHLQFGDAIKTLAYGLQASIIIHAIVPKLGAGHNEEYDRLSLSYTNSLKLADEESCKSIAFPLLGAGNNGFDEKAAYYLAETAIESFKATNKLQNVYLAVYNQGTIEKLEESGVLISDTLIEDEYIKSNPNGKIKVLKTRMSNIVKSIYSK